jgi:hypothetical protein
MARAAASLLANPSHPAPETHALHQIHAESEVVPCVSPTPVFQLRLGRLTVRFKQGYIRDRLAIVGSTNHRSRRCS